MKAAPVIVSMRRAAWAIFILNLTDIALTMWALHLGATEGNPFSAWLIHTKLIFLLKFLVPGWIVFCAYWAKAVPKIDELTVRRAWCIAGVYAMVVVSNSLNIAHRL